MCAQQGRRHFDARSVLMYVSANDAKSAKSVSPKIDTGPRTPLTPFSNIPLKERLYVGCYHKCREEK